MSVSVPILAGPMRGTWWRFRPGERPLPALRVPHYGDSGAEVHLYPLRRWALKNREGEVFAVAGYVPEWMPVEPPPHAVVLTWAAQAMLAS